MEQCKERAPTGHSELQVREGSLQDIMDIQAEDLDEAPQV